MIRQTLFLLPQYFIFVFVTISSFYCWANLSLVLCSAQIAELEAQRRDAEEEREKALIEQRRRREHEVVEFSSIFLRFVRPIPIGEDGPFVTQGKVIGSPLPHP